jgi:hypothetical protein
MAEGFSKSLFRLKRSIILRSRLCRENCPIWAVVKNLECEPFSKWGYPRSPGRTRPCSIMAHLPSLDRDLVVYKKVKFME